VREIVATCGQALAVYDRMFDPNKITKNIALTVGSEPPNDYPMRDGGQKIKVKEMKATDCQKVMEDDVTLMTT